jgi:hypothetical protein
MPEKHGILCREGGGLGWLAFFSYGCSSPLSMELDLKF